MSRPTHRRAGRVVIEAVTALLRACLMRRDAAPWYLVLGTRGSGKTTLVRRSHGCTITPLRDAAAGGVDAYRVDAAVLLDIAGTDSRSQGGHDRSWTHAIDVLLRHRRGIDGVLLVISAAQLRDRTRTDTVAAEKIQPLRARLELLSRRGGVRVPVHVLVTHCDTLYGFEAWAAASNARGAACILGARCEPHADIGVNVDATLADVHRQLHAHRRKSLGPQGNEADLGAELMLPIEIETLRAPLRRDLDACLRPASSDASARLLRKRRAAPKFPQSPRGTGWAQPGPGALCSIHFCCARQCGGARASTAALAPLPEHPDTDAGRFLPSIVACATLPDHPSPEPTEAARLRRQRWMRIALAAWVILICIAAAAIGLAATSAARLRAQRRDVAQPLDPRDTAALLRADAALRRSESTSPLVWLVAAGSGLADLPERQRQRFLDGYRRRQGAACADLGPWPAEDLATMARRVLVLQARADGADAARLLREWPTARPDAEDARTLPVAALARTAPTDSRLLACLHAARSDFDAALGRDESWEALRRAPPLPPGIRPINAADFWRAVPGTINAGGPTPSVPARATLAATRAIDATLTLMRTACTDPLAFDARSARFRQAWLDQRIALWEGFAVDFAAQPPPLADAHAWHVALSTVTGDDSPYARLLRTIGEEFSDQPAQALAPWLGMARHWPTLQARARRFGGHGATVRALAATEMAAMAAMRDMLGADTGPGPRGVGEVASALAAIQRFEAGTSQFAAVAADGRGSALRALSAFHQSGTDAGGDEAASAARQAQRGMHALREVISNTEAGAGIDRASTAPFWRLVEAPLHLALRYAGLQAGCALQARWDADVLWPLRAAATADARKALPPGRAASVFAFASGPARPFLVRTANATDVRTTLGIRAPLLDALPSLLDRVMTAQRNVEQDRIDADRQNQTRARALADARAELSRVETRLTTLSEAIDTARTRGIALRFEAQPTDASPGAKARPSLTELRIDCDDARHVLRNYNFPVSLSVQWAPAHCDAATLTVVVGDIVLRRTYPGPLGVAAMLKDFAGGARTFTSAEFPRHEQALRAAGVRWFTARYIIHARAQAVQRADTLERLERARQQDLARLGSLQDSLAEVGARLGDTATGETQAPEVALSADPIDLPTRIAPCWDTLSEERHVHSASMGVSSQ